MIDPSTLVTNLGVSGLALFILWQLSKLFIGMGEKKDIAHAQERKELDNKQRAEREEFAKRMEKKDDAFRQLEKDVRENMSTVLVECTSAMRQVINSIPKTRKKRVQ